MSRAVPLRVVPAFGGALLVTLAVFLFMRSLIERGEQEEVRLPVYEDVRILRPEPEKDEPEPERDAPEEPAEEPFMEALAVAPPTPQPARSLEIPALDLATGDLDIGAIGDRWSAPLGAGAANFGGGGQDARGYVEVVPFTTRKPNVPEVAFRNRIDGWVLVAFTLTPEGRTRDVRVLDARPRGVFEEKVIAAVEDWQYTLRFKGSDRPNLVLTQRVEVRWKDYPNNLPNVD